MPTMMLKKEKKSRQLKMSQSPLSVDQCHTQPRPLPGAAHIGSGGARGAPQVPRSTYHDTLANWNNVECDKIWKHMVRKL